ncbi:glycerol-3-phosphate dehydrogenase/oxidase [Kribbia dieselivorans]|uniref:glycerol-3-phosphate dehydrogenase/oxidase n=1 Tax=Kribbia dieselivorans TaxID=331526 RepID=UPI00083904B5|nr:glycerol-3-phosphate dehydrogenase/oxidase [Kribbia dieselivorans]
MPRPEPLSPEYRRRAWETLTSRQWEVLVVGGGVTGAGVALDAATRGLDVALIEQRDYASGTSSRSSKLFHGGVRYLEQMNFALVREALRERDLVLTRIAPHLVKPVSFLYPLEHRVWERPYVTTGLTIYDTLGGNRSVPSHKQLSAAQVSALAPGLLPTAHRGGLLYHDAETDDARYTLTLARTAQAYGATVLTSARLVGLIRAGERIVGARVRDVETGEEHTVQTSVVVNCTGVWTDEVQTMAGGRGRFRVRASKGVHIVIARDRINSETGLILRTPTSVLFCIPWGTRWIIGTTDTDWSHNLAHPAATRTDIEYILGQVNSVLRNPLTHDDILGVYAGLRPLLAGEDALTSQLSREHAVGRPQPGMVSIAGGKFTTYRVMAADAVDAALEDLPAGVPDSVTADIPLLGADGYPALVNQQDRFAERHGLPVWRLEHLLNRYGSLVDELVELAQADPRLWEPLPGAEEYLKVEVRHACTHEGALHLEDVLTRRTRISIEVIDRGVAAAPEAAAIMADVLGWSDEQRDMEVEQYRQRVRAELASQDETDDAAADALRTTVGDVRQRALRAETVRVQAGGMSSLNEDD